MDVRHLSPREYWATSQYDIDMAMAVQHAYAEGREQGAEAAKKEAEEREKWERERQEMLEMVRAQMAGQV